MNITILGLSITSFWGKITPEVAREIGKRARERVLKHHTAACRAEELEEYVGELIHKNKVIPA